MNLIYLKKKMNDFFNKTSSDELLKKLYNRKSVDVDFKGTHTFEDITLIELKPSVRRYDIYYAPTGIHGKQYIVTLYYYWSYEKTIKIRSRYAPVIIGTCELEGKKFLVVQGVFKKPNQ